MSSTLQQSYLPDRALPSRPFVGAVQAGQAPRTTTTPLAVVAFSQGRTPFAFLEHLALTGDALTGLRHDLTAFFGEVLVLATCNRLEIYTADRSVSPGSTADTSAADTSAADTSAADTSAAGSAAGSSAAGSSASGDTGFGGDGVVLELLARRCGLPVRQLAEHATVWSGEDAVRHLITVACGLDSLLIGDQQIVGQLRQAYQAAQHLQSAGPVLHQVVQAALQAGRAAKREHGIDEVAGSLVGAALEVAGPVRGQQALVIGSGSMARLAVAALRRADVGEIIVAGRDVDNARRLADQVGASAAPLGMLPIHLGRVDVVVSATSARHHIVTPPMVPARVTPLTVIDLALPGDVDPALGGRRNVRLLTLDTLRTSLAGQASTTTVQAVQQLVDATVQGLAAPSSLATTLALRQHLADLEAGEAAWLTRKISDPDARQLATQALHRLTAKIAHDLTGSRGRS
ncbi:glutamyl-tRNA reductase [Nonomuraea sp. NPDC050663]|uniref:glutamyl-tRNA reductase n=1 Tax=Nonomuraea sp. NPDC050663 TaxID=3364370 RepID=UPI00378A1BCA